MARNFCSMRPFPPFLFPTFSPVFTCMRHPFCWFWAAFRHASMNLAFAAATSGWTKPSVSSSYSRLLSAASRWACAVDWLNSTSATGHLALTAKHPQAEFHPTPPSWNPSSTNMACSFCSMTPISPSLFLNSSLGYTAMLHLFRSFWVAFRHASMNLSLCVATKACAKRSVSRSYSRLLSAASRVVWLNSRRKDMALLVWPCKSGRKGPGPKKSHSHWYSTTFLQPETYQNNVLPMSTHVPLVASTSIVSFLNLIDFLQQLPWQTKESYLGYSPIAPVMSSSLSPTWQTWAMTILQQASAGADWWLIFILCIAPYFSSWHWMVPLVQIKPKIHCHKGTSIYIYI